MKMFAGFRCNPCGSTDFIFAHDPPEADDIMTCAGCKREFGKLADIKALAEKNIQANTETIDAKLKTMLKPDLDA